MIQIPEIRLKTIIDALLDKVRDNYTSATDKSTTFLYKSFYGVVSGNYNFYDQAIKIINRTADDPRTIDTRMLFDRERANMPTIHVTVPAETPIGDGIGMDEGYQVASFADNEPDVLSESYTRGYGSKFEIYITGSNTFEVVLIFYVLKLALLNNVESLEYNGFRNPKIYGGDLRMNDQLAASTAYMRILTIDSFYELIVPKFEGISIVNSINFSGEPYD